MFIRGCVFNVDERMQRMCEVRLNSSESESIKRERANVETKCNSCFFESNSLY